MIYSNQPSPSKTSASRLASNIIMPLQITKHKELEGGSQRHEPHLQSLHDHSLILPQRSQIRTTRNRGNEADAEVHTVITRHYIPSLSSLPPFPMSLNNCSSLLLITASLRLSLWRLSLSLLFSTSVCLSFLLPLLGPLSSLLSFLVDGHIYLVGILASLPRWWSFPTYK